MTSPNIINEQNEIDQQELVDRLKQTFLENEVWWVKRPDCPYLVECRILTITRKRIELAHYGTVLKLDTRSCCFKRNDIEIIEKSVRL